MRIAFIGGGTMAEAILNGVLEKKLATSADIAVVEPIKARRTYLAQQYGIVTTDDAKMATPELVKTSDCSFLECV